MLGSLAQLKQQILAPALAQKSGFDGVLTALGDGVHRAFDRYCNRRFAWDAAHTEIFHAQRSHFYLSATPVVTLTSIEEQATATTWSSVGDFASLLTVFNPVNGKIDFGSVLGTDLELIRVTYAGGYAFDTGDQGWAAPSGATLLPEDIHLAWLLQCEKIWESHDKLGTKIQGGESGATLLGLSLAGLDLIPLVKSMLDPHRRFQMT